jgi:hypothetical protein
LLPGRVPKAVHDALKDLIVLCPDDPVAFIEHECGHSSDADLSRPADSVVNLLPVVSLLQRLAQISPVEPAGHADADHGLEVADVLHVFEEGPEQRTVKTQPLLPLGREFCRLQSQVRIGRKRSPASEGNPEFRTTRLQGRWRIALVCLWLALLAFWRDAWVQEERREPYVDVVLLL